jgi:hypothetical protein
LILHKKDDTTTVMAAKTVNCIFNGSEYELTTYEAFNAVSNNGNNEGLVYLAKVDNNYSFTIDG